MATFTKFIFITIAWSVSVQLAYPQQCGTGELAALRARLLENKAAVAQGLVQPRSTRYVPIKFHLVAKDDGSGRVSVRSVLDQLCALNQDFRSLDIQFYLKLPFNFINNDSVYSHHYNNLNIMEPYRDRNAVNIWIVDNANPTDFEGYVAGYYTNSRDWLVIQRNEVKTFTYTVPHEMGHFFGLLHTFHGWDFDPWQASVHGNPAPPLSPGEVPTERQDGSNCDAAGDYICDTPPDYNFGAFWLDCNYSGGAKDPGGTMVNPDESNFMGYFDACERSNYHFSPQQKNYMSADLSSPRRNFLRNNNYPGPEYLQFSGTPALQQPANGATTPFFNQVELRWSAVEGANQYLVEISSTPVFSNIIDLQVVRDTLATVTRLAAGRNYFWRVQPFNEYYTCTDLSIRSSFRTSNLSTVVSSIREINDWQISPNPTRQGASVTLDLQNGKAFVAQVEIRNLTGQVLQNFGKRSFSAGNQQVTLPTVALPPGVYAIALRNNTGSSVRKWVVQ